MCTGKSARWSLCFGTLQLVRICSYQGGIFLSEAKLFKVTEVLLHLIYNQRMEKKDCQEKRRNIRSSEPYQRVSSAVWWPSTALRTEAEESLKTLNQGSASSCLCQVLYKIWQHLWPWWKWKYTCVPTKTDIILGGSCNMTYPKLSTDNTERWYFSQE